jgi:hypothetical protein
VSEEQGMVWQARIRFCVLRSILLFVLACISNVYALSHSPMQCVPGAPDNQKEIIESIFKTACDGKVTICDKNTTSLPDGIVQMMSVKTDPKENTNSKRGTYFFTKNEIKFYNPETKQIESRILPEYFRTRIETQAKFENENTLKIAAADIPNDLVDKYDDFFHIDPQGDVNLNLKELFASDDPFKLKANQPTKSKQNSLPLAPDFSSLKKTQAFIPDISSIFEKKNSKKKKSDQETSLFDLPPTSFTSIPRLVSSISSSLAKNFSRTLENLKSSFGYGAQALIPIIPNYHPSLGSTEFYEPASQDFSTNSDSTYNTESSGSDSRLTMSRGESSSLGSNHSPLAGTQGDVISKQASVQNDLDNKIADLANGILQNLEAPSKNSILASLSTNFNSLNAFNIIRTSFNLEKLVNDTENSSHQKEEEEVSESSAGWTLSADGILLPKNTKTNRVSSRDHQPSKTSSSKYIENGVAILSTSPRRRKIKIQN